MATLGYGDLFPISYGGRVVGMIGCFWGVFILSTMVVILNQLLDFTPGEKKSFAILIRMKLKDELKLSTVDVIMSSQKHKYERARDETDFKALSGAYTIFRKNIFIKFNQFFLFQLPVIYFSCFYTVFLQRFVENIIG